MRRKYNPSALQLKKELGACKWIKSRLAREKGVDEKIVRLLCKQYGVSVKKEKRKEVNRIIKPGQNIFIPKRYVNDRLYNTLVFGDIHAPFHLPEYLDFLVDTKKKYKCDRVANIGDELDFHKISFHPHDPDGMGKLEEFEAGLEYMKQLYKAFPNVDCCVSNHTSRPFRKAFDAGIPSVFLKDYREWMKAPKGWNWYDEFEINNVVYAHAPSGSGKNAPLDTAIGKRQSFACGHLHHSGGVMYNSSNNDILFGLNVGCGVDSRSYAFAYGKGFKYRPTVGCGVVLGGKEGIFVPMDLGSKIQKLR